MTIGTAGALSFLEWTDGSVKTRDASAGDASNATWNVASVPSITRRSPPFTVLGLTPVYAGGLSATSNAVSASGYRTSSL